MQAGGLELCLPSESVRATEGGVDRVQDKSNASVKEEDTVASRRDGEGTGGGGHGRGGGGGDGRDAQSSLKILGGAVCLCGSCAVAALVLSTVCF